MHPLKKSPKIVDITDCGIYLWLRMLTQPFPLQLRGGRTADKCSFLSGSSLYYVADADTDKYLFRSNCAMICQEVSEYSEARKRVLSELCDNSLEGRH